MKYLLLIYNNDETDRRIARDQGVELDRTHESVITDLMATGEWVETHELDQDDAVVVRTGPGRTPLTDGPFAHGTEIVGGYYIVDVADRTRAVEIAQRFLEAATSVIEVRRIAST